MKPVFQVGIFEMMIY